MYLNIHMQAKSVPSKQVKNGASRVLVATANLLVLTAVPNGQNTRQWGSIHTLEKPALKKRLY